jgi:hypothetical protein
MEQQRNAELPDPAAPTLAAESESEPAPPMRKRTRRKPSSGHGGARANAGVKPIGPSPRTAAAYIALTAREKRELEQKARKAGLSVSSYIRKRLGFLV